MDILTASAEMLSDAGYDTSRQSINDRAFIAFEDATVLGFLFAYSDAASLIDCWVQDERRVVGEHQFALRRAGQKAWNTYVVFLTDAPPDYAASVRLNAIEEDLGGTRKVARAGIRDSFDLRGALLPLLPLQAAPKLEAVDMHAEIRQRATDLQGRAVDAFLHRAEDVVILQVLEEDS